MVCLILMSVGRKSVIAGGGQEHAVLRSKAVKAEVLAVIQDVVPNMVKI